MPMNALPKNVIETIVRIAAEPLKPVTVIPAGSQWMGWSRKGIETKPSRKRKAQMIFNTRMLEALRISEPDECACSDAERRIRGCCGIEWVY
jgi:hypothetical protein